MTHFRDVGMWMDFIDANRSSLLDDLIEGRGYGDLSTRLRNINVLIKKSEERVEIIQQTLRLSNLETSSYLMLVDALKSEVQIRVNELVELNEELGIYKDKNEELAEKVKLRGHDVDEVSRRACGKQAGMWQAGG